MRFVTESSEVLFRPSESVYVKHVTCGTWLIINLLLISRKLQVHMVSRPYPRTKESVTIAKVALLLSCFKNLSVGSTGNRTQSYRLTVPYPAINLACQSAVKDLLYGY